jgi:hypothetical protein
VPTIPKSFRALNMTTWASDLPVSEGVGAKRVDTVVRARANCHCMLLYSSSGSELI